MIRVLRPRTGPGHVSAEVFADAFSSGLWPEVLVEDVPAVAWLNESLHGAPLGVSDAAAAHHFKAATAGYDFFCPDYRVTALVPWLLHLRNLSGSRLRLLLIAHAPGAIGLEWALLSALMRPGDRIVAPTESARDVIAFLSPPLAAYTRVVPHPLEPLPAVSAPAQPGVRRLVSLTRVHSSKLLHVQIDAMALLRDRGVRNIALQIAGPLDSPDTGRRLAYSRALSVQIERLDLDADVSLVGTIRGNAAKAAFLSGATALLNLSISIEESLGKAIVEALGCGVPVVTTRWDGLCETAGAGGVAVPVRAAGPGLGLEVSAADVADAIEQVMTSPPSSETCREESARFAPAVIGKAYRTMLEQALSGEPEAPSQVAAGLLAATAPLTVLCASELFDLHVRDWPRQLALLGGGEAGTPSAAERLRALVLVGTWRPLERLLAGLDPTEESCPIGPPVGDRPPGDDLLDAVTWAGRCRATLGSRLGCAAELAQAGRAEELAEVLTALCNDGLPRRRGAYFEVELLRLRGATAEALATALATEPPLRADLAERFRQLGTLAREAGRPAEALPALRSWLAAFPDALGAGAVWVERAACAAGCSPPLWHEAAASTRQARRLLDRDDGGVVTPRSLLADIELGYGPVSSVNALSRHGTTLLVQAGPHELVAQRMSSSQDPLAIVGMVRQLTRRTPPLCPPLLAMLPDDKGAWLLTEYVRGTDRSAPWPTVLQLLSVLRQIPAPGLHRLEPIWLRRLAVVSDDAQAATLLAELHATMPCTPPVLAHGDPHPGNVLAGAEGPLLVDWEEIGAAAAGFDAGWLLALARTGGLPWDRKEMWTDLVARGFAPEILRWSERLGVLRLLYRARAMTLTPEVRRLLLLHVRRSIVELDNSDRDLRSLA